MNEVVRSEPLTAHLLPIQGHQFFMSLGLHAEQEGVFLVQALLLLIEAGSDEWHRDQGLPLEFTPR